MVKGILLIFRAKISSRVLGFSVTVFLPTFLVQSVLQAENSQTANFSFRRICCLEISEFQKSVLLNVTAQYKYQFPVLFPNYGKYQELATDGGLYM